MAWDADTGFPYLVLGTFSMVASLFIILSFYCIKDFRRRNVTRLVFYLSICELFLSLKFIIPAAQGFSDTNDKSAFCAFQGVMGHFFGLAAASWYFCIAIGAYLALYEKQIQSHVIQEREFKSHYLAWGVSFVCTAIVWGQSDFGYSSDSTCWVRGNQNSLRLFFFLPLLFYFIFTIYLFRKVYEKRHILLNGKNCAFVRMMAFVTIFAVTWFWSLFLWFIEMAGDISPGFFVEMHRLAISSQGLLNFFVWISYPGFAPLWKHCPNRYCTFDDFGEEPSMMHSPLAGTLVESIPEEEQGTPYASLAQHADQAPQRIVVPTSELQDVQEFAIEQPSVYEGSPPKDGSNPLSDSPT